MWALHWFSELVPLRTLFGMKNSQRLTKDFHASPSNQLLGPNAWDYDQVNAIARYAFGLAAFSV
jgi:hypothetical protein